MGNRALNTNGHHSAHDYLIRAVLESTRRERSRPGEQSPAHAASAISGGEMGSAEERLDRCDQSGQIVRDSRLQDIQIHVDVVVDEMGRIPKAGFQSMLGVAARSSRETLLRFSPTSLMCLAAASTVSDRRARPRRRCGCG